MNNWNTVFEMQIHYNIFILLSLLGGISKVSGWYETDIVQVGPIVTSSKVINYNLRPRKINRTTCAIYGNIEILIESKEASLYQVHT